MDVSFTNVLEGARQYFQGLPSANAAVGPYNFQQQNVPAQQEHTQNQQQQQLPQSHGYYHHQQENGHYPEQSSSSSATTNQHWRQPSPVADSNRAPSRERTPIQRPPSHNSSGGSSNSRPSSANTPQYQDISRQYPGSYSQPSSSSSSSSVQAADLNNAPPNASTASSFQFMRPQSRDLQSLQYHQQSINNYPTYQPPAPSASQVSRPSSRDQLASSSSPNVQNYHTMTPRTVIPQQQSHYNNYQPPPPPRPYYSNTHQHQPQVSTVKSENNNYPSAQQQQIYARQNNMPSTNNNNNNPRMQHYAEGNINNSQYHHHHHQTSLGNEHTYRATHNLPPIAALSSYSAAKIGAKDTSKVLSNIRGKVPPSSITTTYSSASSSISSTHSSTIQYTTSSRSTTDSSSYIHQNPSSNNMYHHQNNAQRLNQQQQQQQPQVSTVITQSYSNVIMTTANSSSHYSQNNHVPASVTYQSRGAAAVAARSAEIHQNVPNQNLSINSQNNNNSFLSNETSVIKQRKESPLDLSVKTVKTSADSTHEGTQNNKLQSTSLSTHNYPTLDVNSIEKSFSQKSGSQLPRATTAPKVEFHPNFNLSSKYSGGGWNPSKVSEESVPKRVFHENNLNQQNNDYNNMQNNIYQQQDYSNSNNTSGRYPPTNVPPQYMRHPYDGRELTAKRPGEIGSPAIPTKIAKVENWRESINLQIEEKFTSHYKQQQLQQSSTQQQQQQQQQRVQTVLQHHKTSDNTTSLMNGNYSRSSNSASVNNNTYNNNYYQRPYHNYQQTSYDKKMSYYPQPRQNFVPPPSGTTNHHHYPGYFNPATNHKPPPPPPPSAAGNMYVNPAAIRNSNSLPNIPRTTNPGADKRVLSLLRNSIESKEQKKIIEQQNKSQEIIMNDIQHPSMDVTAPLQPKPGIDRINVSPFTPITVPDPNLCKIPSVKVNASSIDPHQLINNNNEENTVLATNNDDNNAATNNDYDGLAAFLAARIRTKGELKELAQNQANSQAARDARIQAFLEDTMKSPHHRLTSSPPKLLKEKQQQQQQSASAAFSPRKRLFSRNEEDDIGSKQHHHPPREKSGLRSSSETSVFDFPDSEDENEMPVLERQTLEAMRKDRRNSLKQSSSDICTIETLSRAPSPEDDLFGSICDKFVEQLKSKPTKRVKRTLFLEIKLEPPSEPSPASASVDLLGVKVKIEAPSMDDDIIIKPNNNNNNNNSNSNNQNNSSIEIKTELKVENMTNNNNNTPIIKNVINNYSSSDSNFNDSVIKNEDCVLELNKNRVRRKILSSDEAIIISDNNEENKKSIENNVIVKVEISDKIENVAEKVINNTTTTTTTTERVEVDKIKKEKTDDVDVETPTSPSNNNNNNNINNKKTMDLILAINRPAKKPSFGDGSDFYPGWEEGLYRYKKSLRMPPSLIQLTRPPTRLSTSLPDLDPCPQSPTASINADLEPKDLVSCNKKCKSFKSEPLDTSDSESTTSSFNLFCKKINYDSEGSSSIRSLPNTRKENMSILDRLLEKCGGRRKRNQKRKEADHSPKIIPKSENPVELLATPTPGLELLSNQSPEKSTGLSCPVINTTSAVLPFRKDTVKHFKDAFINSGNNILGVHNKFTTIILSSRTRKETRAMKQRATIKEVFGEDRPASAPPVTCSINHDLISSSGALENLEPFSKNLEEILIKKEKIDEDLRVRNAFKVLKDNHQQQQQQQQSIENCKVNKQPEEIIKIKDEIIIPDEDDEEENKKLSDLIVIKKDPEDACSETMSIDSEEIIHNNNGVISVKRRSKFGKIRRKFSSGFDYIRKKKKIKKEDSENGSVERKKRLPGKIPESIDDIQKEIKSWVLNKGVGESHLHRAARLGYVDVTAYCLDRMNCPPGPKDNAGYTPLHEACTKGHLEIAKLLLKYGANVHEAAKGGIRPLHEAIENGFVEIVRLLLSYGADPSLATYAGTTPLDLATDEHTKQLIKDHLSDRKGECGGTPWLFYGPASCFDPEESGYNVLNDLPQEDSEKELDDVEFDMSEGLLPNLYTIRDEPPTDKWVLLQDLSHSLKIKSRDALLRQISSPSSATTTTTTTTTTNMKANNNSYKNTIRELKMSEFLEQAYCCQFLNMGEKINARASKIALVRYTDRVKELLGIESVLISTR